MTDGGWLGAARTRPDTTGDLLEGLCRSCLRDAGVDGVCLSVVAADGTPEPVHATDELSERLGDLQFTLGEGPCAEVVRTASPVLLPTLADASARWPTFVAEAGSAGVSALFAVPIGIRAATFGTLELHRREPGPLSRSQLALTLSSAEAAAWLVLSMWGPAAADDARPGSPPPPYRMVVHQAAGMVMVQLDVGVEEALVRLRSTAYAEGRSINDLAADLVAGRRRLTREDA